MNVALADTGALVALLDRSDKWHKWAVANFRKLQPPLLTCEAVLAETWYLLERVPLARNALVRLFKTGVIKLALSFAAEAEGIWPLLEKYADVPMDLADACLVRMSELNALHKVWTVDSDFTVYRRNVRQIIPLIIPAQN